MMAPAVTMPVSLPPAVVAPRFLLC